MKVGDLVRWRQDNDIGIIVGWAREVVDGVEYEADDDNPKIQWFLYPPNDIDTSIPGDDPDLELLNENR